MMAASGLKKVCYSVCLLMLPPLIITINKRRKTQVHRLLPREEGDVYQTDGANRELGKQ